MASNVPFEFDFSPEALDRALRGEPSAGGEEPFADDGELRHVARRIAGDHVEVVARFVRMTFSGTATDTDRVQFATALGSLARLATEVGDVGQAHLLGRTQQDVHRSSRRLLLARLQRFVEEFSSTLEGEDARRLRELVEYDPDEAPLLAELAAVRGIGPRRLERLFCCGLYTVEAVAHADPAEVAAVAGLPVALAERVVVAAREYAERERATAIREARARIRDFQRLVASSRDPVPAETIREAALALRDLEDVLNLLMQTRSYP